MFSSESFSVKCFFFLPAVCSRLSFFCRFFPLLSSQESEVQFFLWSFPLYALHICPHSPSLSLPLSQTVTISSLLSVPPHCSFLLPCSCWFSPWYPSHADRLEEVLWSEFRPLNLYCRCLLLPHHLSLSVTYASVLAEPASLSSTPAACLPHPCSIDPAEAPFT